MKEEKGLPEGFAERMRQQLGEGFQAFGKALQGEPVTAVRLNPRKPGAELFFAAKVPWAENGFYLAERPNFAHDPLFHAGGYYVQDASAMFLEHLLPALPKSALVLDAAAAPGGKSIALAEKYGEATILSNEIDRRRANILAENLVKWGRPNHIVTNTQLDKTEGSGLQFDLILLDAPCSGEGMMRKDPEAQRQWSESLVAQCSTLQRQLVQTCWQMLKPGGYLVYATCTFNPEENVAPLLPLLKAAESVAVSVPPEWGVTVREAEGTTGYYFYPHLTKGEGQYFCLLKKKGPIGAFQDFGSAKHASLPKPLASQLAEVAQLPGGWEALLQNERAVALSKEQKGVLDKLAQAKVPTMHAGVPLAETKRGKLIRYDHALAMSTAVVCRGIEPVPLSKEEALAYLALKPFKLPETQSTGWQTVTFKGINLGFMKNIGTRFNNYYPTQWRLRVY